MLYYCVIHDEYSVWILYSHTRTRAKKAEYELNHKSQSSFGPRQSAYPVRTGQAEFSNVGFNVYFIRTETPYHLPLRTGLPYTNYWTVRHSLSSKRSLTSQIHWPSDRLYFILRPEVDPSVSSASVLVAVLFLQLLASLGPQHLEISFSMHLLPLTREQRVSLSRPDLIFVIWGNPTTQVCLLAEARVFTCIMS